MSVTALDNIAVAIVFPIGNRYHTMGVLKEFHGKHVKQLVFYGYERLENAPPGLIVYKDHMSYLLYRALIDLVHKYPNADGWMAMHDDYWVNWTKLAQLDLTKVIYPRTEHLYPMLHDYTKVNRTSWHWWNTPWGISAYEKGKPYFKNAYGKDHFPTVDNPIGCGWADFQYIPKAHKDLMLHNLTACSNCELFTEISWPQSVFMSVPKEDVLYVPGIPHLWAHTPRQTSFEADYETNVMIHPVKFADAPTVEFLKQKNLF